ncbi:uncharacterized protein Dana_GF14680 [Drosophila ananassae]|uniref:Chitin-binding type-2 domain-containing protein n=1 Tax=Drosophila ananassae TaxID=7217 RepID=B3MP06_DROAN|nr:uncharacterized protein LOC6497501 [Drosophila ananassae]EDV31172.1 uncharacterized protein Dana_GF14680 [Drosophila ananassae]
MKATLVLLCLALFVAVVLACDPDSNNQPICNSTIIGKKIRNFWDPTRYWQCTDATGNGAAVLCPDQTGFLESADDCVAWSNWTWVAPCPNN